MITAALIAVLLAAPSPVLAATLPLTVPQPPDPKEEWIDALAHCENTTGSTTLRILDTNDKYSHGILMFQMGTWLSFGKKFGATKQNIYDPELQRRVARSMLDDGLWRHWYNCAKDVTKRKGAYPVGKEE